MAWVRKVSLKTAPARWRQVLGGAARYGSCETLVPVRSCNTGSELMSKATAKNDNQNPACNIAQGSSKHTTQPAAKSTTGCGQRAPMLRNSTTTPIIHTVRCAGTPQPASKAYKNASIKPPQRAASGTGASKIKRVDCRQNQPTTAPANQANMVTCRPEMLIKCATPVARKMSQSSRSMAAWSPIASAARTPAAVRLLTWRSIASRTLWRACSMG